jgi:hypothetical protein
MNSVASHVQSTFHPSIPSRKSVLCLRPRECVTEANTGTLNANETLYTLVFRPVRSNPMKVFYPIEPSIVTINGSFSRRQSVMLTRTPSTRCLDPEPPVHDTLRTTGRLDPDRSLNDGSNISTRLPNRPTVDGGSLAFGRRLAGGGAGRIIIIFLPLLLLLLRVGRSLLNFTVHRSPAYIQALPIELDRARDLSVDATEWSDLAPLSPDLAIRG